MKQRDRLGIRLVVALVAGTIVMSDWTVAEAFDFFGLFGSDDTPPAVSRAAIPYTLTVQVAGDPSGLKDSSERRVVALQPAQGRSRRRRSARAARPKRFCAGHRRALGRGLLQRQGDDRDRRREPRHRLDRHRRLRARRRSLSQSQRRPGRHQGRPRPLVQAPQCARCRRARRGIPGSRAAAAHRRPQAWRSGGGERNPRRSNPHRRLFPTSKGARWPRSSRSRRSSTTRRTSWT